MTSTARLARRLLVAALALAVLVSAAPSLAAASAGPPKHKTPSTPGKHKDGGKKKHKKKKSDTKKKKKKRKKSNTKPPARTPVPTPQPDPQPQPPADPGPEAFEVVASGGYHFLYTEQWGGSNAKTETKFDWRAVGLAAVSRGATDADFQLADGRVSGFLKNYSFERSSSFTTLDYDGTTAHCARAYVETPTAGGKHLNLSLGGHTAADLGVAVGDDSFDIATASSASGPTACASPPALTSIRTYWVDGLKLSFQPVGGSNGATSCTTSGSFEAGFTRSCTATRFLGTTHMEQWTMEVKLIPVGW